MMEVKEPAQEQKREFWEWCGLKHDWQRCQANCVRCSHCGAHTYKSCEKDYHDQLCTLPIDLNSLFKWAVPKAIECLRTKMFKNMSMFKAREALFKLWLRKIEEGMTEEVALFWALWEVMKEDKR